MFTTSTPLVANGSTPAVPYSATTGRCTVAAWGTFGGGTLTMEMSPDGGTTWIALDPSGSTVNTFTANGVGNFQINIDCLVRATLSGATTPSVNVKFGGKDDA